MNRQQLLSRVGRRYQVLYSSGAWFTWNRHTPEWRRASWWGAFERHDNVWVDEPPRLLLRTSRLETVDDFVLRRLARRWRRFLEAGGNKSLVAYVFHPMFLPYLRWLGAERLVYHAYDLYEYTPGWTAALERAERELVLAADVVIAASEQIAKGLARRGARAVRVLPNAADVAAFERECNSDAPPPADLARISSPRLGYIGSLHPQVHYGLIADLAKRKPEWNFVFVGPIIPHADARADAERKTCEVLPNVHFLGGKRIDEVPMYVAHMDVNLMCYRLSDHTWIQAIYPLKLHEYLAAGHPVVSADIPAVRPFSGVVRIADGPDDWEAAIGDALAGRGRGSTNERRMVARENSWDQRADVLDTWLMELGGDRVRDA